VRRARREFAVPYIVCTSVGPFALPADLRRRQTRPLTDGQLDVFFATEKRLKVNRLVYSLREVSDADD
jgi:hypothetical protein